MEMSGQPQAMVVFTPGGSVTGIHFIAVIGTQSCSEHGGKETISSTLTGNKTPTI